MRDIIDGWLDRGADQAKREAAERMIKDGVLSDEKIAVYSGLTLEQVKELRDKINKLVTA